jgi:hypothetical protein
MNYCRRVFWVVVLSIRRIKKTFLNFTLFFNLSRLVPPPILFFIIWICFLNFWKWRHWINSWTVSLIFVGVDNNRWEWRHLLTSNESSNPPKKNTKNNSHRFGRELQIFSQLNIFVAFSVCYFWLRGRVCILQEFIIMSTAPILLLLLQRNNKQSELQIWLFFVRPPSSVIKRLNIFSFFLKR